MSKINAMILVISLLLTGFILLIKGADWLVDGASAMAKKYRVSNLAIGLTVVAFGTSVPELVVNVFAAFEGHHDIVFGNIIGSNNFNLFIILGITGLIVPLTVQTSTVWKEIPISLVAVLMLMLLSNEMIMSNSTMVSRAEGIVLLLCFAFFLWYVFKQLKHSDETVVSVNNYSSLKIWSFIALGLTCLVIGGRLIVNNAVQLATIFGVSEKVIGLTIVAAGTSLPEMATSVIAAIKKNNDIAVGNIIGSNVFNIFLIIGISSIIKPLQFNVVFNIDLLILIAGTLFLFMAMFTGKKHKLDRWEAAILLVFYLGYMGYVVYGTIH